MAKHHWYAMRLVNLDRRVVEDFRETHQTVSLETYYAGLSADAIQRIEGVATDILATYMTATRKHVPNADAKIIHDRFHIVKQAIRPMDSVRRAEHTRLLREGDEALTKTRHLWLFRIENVSERRKSDLDKLRRTNLVARRVWLWKKDLLLLWRAMNPRPPETPWPISCAGSNG